MKTSRLLPLALAALLTTGCAVMHFRNGSVESAGEPTGTWHHNVVFGQYEFGAPMRIGELCPETGNWSMITTKETFATGLLGWLDVMVVYVDIWDPQVVEYTCGGK